MAIQLSTYANHSDDYETKNLSLLRICSTIIICYFIHRKRTKGIESISIGLFANESDQKIMITSNEKVSVCIDLNASVY